ncbi:MAG: class I SAM-dependent methyltransferase [Fidelibacterota bacterium]|nr:MAG: class I SAM-dependent methyltransferase [Candidatus Neomarinimicrobiota bacterium]
MTIQRLTKTVLACTVLVTVALTRPLPQLASVEGLGASITDGKPSLVLAAEGEGASANNHSWKGHQEVIEELEASRTPDVIFVPTPQDVVEIMLELAEVKRDDLLYDLGCGDGRIVVTAAREYGSRCIGYDIDPQRVKESLENVKENNVEHLVKIEQQDIFTLDLSEASVITLYLLKSLNTRLIPQLEKLKPGSRIVSHDYDMSGVKPDTAFTVDSIEDDYEHSIFLWTTPLEKVEESDE